jgi:hypothetical protein
MNCCPGVLDGLFLESTADDGLILASEAGLILESAPWSAHQPVPARS